MKRILFVLALTLILTLSFVGQSYALNRPWNYDQDGSGGDDHPWGGDNSSTDPTPNPISIKIGNNGSYATGISVIDVFFRLYIIERVRIVDYNSTQERINRAESTTYSTSNRKGISR